MAQTNILLETGTNELEIVEFYVNQDGYEAHYAENREHYHCCGQRVNKRKPGFVGRLRQQTEHHKNDCGNQIGRAHV